VAQYGERVKPAGWKCAMRPPQGCRAVAVDSFGRLDVLVHNAGYGKFAPFRADECGGLPAIVTHAFYGVV